MFLPTFVTVTFMKQNLFDAHFYHYNETLSLSEIQILTDCIRNEELSSGTEGRWTKKDETRPVERRLAALQGGKLKRLDGSLWRQRREDEF